MEILITGGTGSLGKTLVKHILANDLATGIRIYSRDELKQWEMRRELNDPANTAWLIGDVRDEARLRRACEGVDLVINCAAMKQVPACEYNPLEAIKTNVHGAENLINAAIDTKVKKVMHISTDKAVYPVNLYGATKLAAEKLFVHGNVYAGADDTKFSVCRYGNVFGSRGSVLHVFKRCVEEGKSIPITHADMTRFWIRLHEVVGFIFESIDAMIEGGEIFVPKMHSMKITDMAHHFNDKFTGYHCIGIRPGEKIHETLITDEEARHTRDCSNRFVIYPAGSLMAKALSTETQAYTSNTNAHWLSPAMYKQWLAEEGF